MYKTIFSIYNGITISKDKQYPRPLEIKSRRGNISSMKSALFQKVKTLSQLRQTIRKLKKEGKKIVLCHGVFDLIHPGHIRHLTSAKKYGDILVITVTADKYIKKGPGRPIFQEALRAEVLSSLNMVDFVAILNSESAVEAIKALKPDYYVKGPDYKSRKKRSKIPQKLIDETQALQVFGGKTVFTDDIVFSSSKLISEYLSVYPKKTKEYLDDLKNRYSADYITDRLSTLENLKIIVIGDSIIDQYHYCFPVGKSSKEPLIVHQFMIDENFAGGVLATANHLASLTKNIHLVSLLGTKKSFEKFILKHLKTNITPKFFYRTDTSTTVKRRYLDRFTQQKLFQISYLNDDPIEPILEKKINKYLKVEIKKFDFVIVNDFGHGLLTEKLIRTICHEAKYLALNVQSNSANYGFNVITKYPRADFVCIDEHEIRLAAHDKYSDLRFLIKKIYKKMKSTLMIITRGSNGSLSYTEKGGFYETPALTDKVVDRVGAGDALFSIASPCAYKTLETEIIPFIGNVAGALQIQIVGHRKSIEFATMVKFINRLLI